MTCTCPASAEEAPKSGFRRYYLAGEARTTRSEAHYPECPLHLTAEQKMRMDNPLDPEFWWSNHERLMRENVLTTPLRRNPSDIREALDLTPEAREPILNALKAAQRFHNIGAHQAADETAIYTAIARLMDAGILSRKMADKLNRKD